MSGEPTTEVKRTLLTQELSLWRNTRYQQEIRLRVAKRIDSDTENQAAIMQQLERCEKAIDMLEDELTRLDDNKVPYVSPVSQTA